MKYANLFGSVLLTIIIIVVVQVISIRYRINSNVDPSFDSITEGFGGSGSGSGSTYNNQPNLAQLLTSNDISHTPPQLASLRELIFNNYKISNNDIKSMIPQARLVGITDSPALFNNINAIHRLSSSVNYSNVFSELNNFGIVDQASASEFFKTAEPLKLNTLTGNHKYSLFQSGDKTTLFSLFSSIGVNNRNYKEFLSHVNITDPNILCEFIVIIKGFGFAYGTDENNVKELMTMINGENDKIAGAKNLQTTLNSIHTTWPSYLAYSQQIISLAGPQSKMPAAVKVFIDYFGKVATSDSATFSYTQLTKSDDNVAQMLNVMNFINNQSSKNYFYYSNNVASTDLKKYWELINRHTLTIYQIIKEAKMGSTANSYVNAIPRKPENFENRNSALRQMSNLWKDVKSYLFGQEGFGTTNFKTITIEKARNLRMTMSDDQIFQNFGITNHHDRMEIKTSMNKYKIINNTTDWENIMVLITVLQSAGVRYANLNEYSTLMNSFDARTVDQWIEFLGYMEELNIKTYDKASRFIKTLVKFKVKYNGNFSMFMERINNFGFAKLSNNFDNFELFVDNMITIGYNYKDNSDQVNTILDYLTKLGFDFTQYKLGSLANNIIMLLFEYSSKTDYIGNALKDILNYERLNLNNIELKGDTGPRLYQRIAKQATIIAEGNQSENNLIYANKQDIIPFLYEKEFKQIVEKNQFSESEIVIIMKSVGQGMHNYAKSLDKKMDGVDKRIKKLNVVRLIIDMYPYTVFQFLTTEIRSNPDQLFSSVDENGSNKKSQFRPKNE